MRVLKKTDIDKNIRTKVYSQNYLKHRTIKDVNIIKLQNIASEEGDFGELMRLNKNNTLQSIPGFKVAQINRTHLIPGSIKAWHLHYRQDEVWYACPSDHVLVGLWDVRVNSPTYGSTMRHVLGAGTSQLIHIPHGVAHGSVVLSSKPIELYVFVNMHFKIKNHDERRFPWDSLGADFWLPRKD